MRYKDELALTEGKAETKYTSEGRWWDTDGTNQGRAVNHTGGRNMRADCKVSELRGEVRITEIKLKTLNGWMMQRKHNPRFRVGYETIWQWAFIHQLAILIILWASWVGLKSIQADIEQELGYTLDRSSVSQRAYTKGQITTLPHIYSYMQFRVAN